MILKTNINKLKNGIKINDFNIYVKNISAGRFKEETNLNLYVKHNTYKDRLLDIKIYYGIQPFYHSWIEFSNINNDINLGKKIKYFDSKIEGYIIKLFSKSLNRGEKIYIEYNNDKETSYALTYNYPPVVTRLGFKLFNLGFTWFKDWYFPEGGNEGGQKLQGEKPLNKKSKDKHINNIKNEVQIFLGKSEQDFENTKYLKKARKRGKKLINATS